MASFLMDNDVLLKLSCYGLQSELEGFLRDRSATSAVLAVAAFVLRRYVNRLQSITDRDRARANLERLLAACGHIEPSAEELAVAIELEEQAQLLGLQFDTGESQLISVLSARQAALLITGDKRAIGVMERLGLTSGVHGRVGCLEQLILCFVVSNGAFQIRASICQEGMMDKSLAICFSCSGPVVSCASITEGLRSYIGAVRQAAGSLLAEDSLRLGLVT